MDPTAFEVEQSLGSEADEQLTTLTRTTTCATMITEMRVADFFELIKSVIFVIRCGSNFLEFKTVMDINSHAGYFF